ncbi:hypothetical protein BOTBODRAFT_193321 [Botryobasidium botryosum FD-172 SS1]|uniref:DUF6589 domain-containing protein n=1 Tax=Botryobasidium botryosum (strain FD-172 SS1) TaxID=930990 RepID=A0A067M121_BOTB1|nr:hypothetical protein BOTBODRAFT_193321 [Botryobasidium botryosum FD-172 SS1]
MDADPLPRPIIPQTSPSNTRKRKSRTTATLSKSQRVRNVLAYLGSQQLNVASFLDALLWGEPSLLDDNVVKSARQSFCASPLLPAILTHLASPPRTNAASRKTVGASSVVRKWVLGQAQVIVAKEIELFGATMQDNGLDPTADSLLKITLDEISATLKRIAPGVFGLLRAIAQSPSQLKRNTMKDPTVTITVVACQLAYHRNTNYNQFQQIIGLYLKGKAAPSKAIDIVHRCGLCMSYSWTCKAIRSLSKEAMESLKKWLEENLPFILHDNVRLVFRVTTQRVNNQTHGDNGTAATVIALPRSATEILASYGELMRPKWDEIAEAFRSGDYPERMLSLKDLLQRNNQDQYRAFSIHNVITVLLDSPQFSQYRHRDHRLLAPPPPVHAMPTGPEHRTKYWMLGTVPIEEASYDGNEQVINEMLRQIGFNDDKTKARLAIECAIPWGGDQLTESRLRMIKHFRSDDYNGFDRRDFIIPVFGWFHVTMCLANAIFKGHRGPPKGYGFDRDIALLGIKGLAASEKKPQFHTIDNLLHTEHTARFREAWLWATSEDTLESLFTTLNDDPDPSRLCHFAEKIVDKRASAAAAVGLQSLRQHDYVLEASVLLLRDLDLYIHLRRTIRGGDVGRLEALIPTLIFHFNGSSNGLYCKMLVEHMQWHLYEAPPKVSRVIRDHCWLVNRTGKPNNFLPPDQLQEHNNGGIKHVHAPLGVNATWPLITALSPVIPVFNAITDHIDRLFGVIHGSRHTEPEGETDLRILGKALHAVNALTFDLKRPRAPKSMPCKDAWFEGQRELSITNYLRNWWDSRRPFMAYRRSSQIFEGPPTTSAPPAPTPVAGDDVDYFAEFENPYDFIDDAIEQELLGQRKDALVDMY